MKLNAQLAKTFQLPLIVLGIIIFSVFFSLIHQSFLASAAAILATLLGGYPLVDETIRGLLKKQFALDYIAILAIVLSLLTHEYLVGSIIAFMIASGRTLEEYGVSQAKTSLTSLIDRIPNSAILWEKGKMGATVKIHDVKVGQSIFIRRGEVIPLDGILVFQSGLADEASLTGEPYGVEKIEGDFMRSGTINIGDAVVIKVTKEEKDSTYNKIIALVKNAQEEKAPLVRLADKYSAVFTVISLIIAGFAYAISHDFTRVLSVLVIATPCPLILATPIALLGGVNAAAKKRIIVKRLAALEVLSRVNTIIFDKTGTITLGKPRVSEFQIEEKKYSEKELLGIAESIERNSLHPLAKAVMVFAQEKKAPIFHAGNVHEKIGKGISGVVNKKEYMLSKISKEPGMAIGLYEKENLLAIFRFEDEIKNDAKKIIHNLKKMGMALHIFTGDKKEAAQKVVRELGEDVIVKAECTPEDKKEGIELLKKQGKVTAMVGDGINDAPALALSDVGMVFSNEDQTAASEAADIVFLGGDFSQVNKMIVIAKSTTFIALTSIFVGIGLSIGGMAFASVGLIPPVIGAVLQEAIDVIAILNALRASRLS